MQLADLESREVLLAKLAGAMKGSLAKAARVFDALRIKMEASAPASAPVAQAAPVAEAVVEEAAPVAEATPEETPEVVAEVAAEATDAAETPAE
jgi:large subunit ribosomal protein L10